MNKEIAKQPITMKTVLYTLHAFAWFVIWFSLMALTAKGGRAYFSIIFIFLTFLCGWAYGYTEDKFFNQTKKPK